MRKLKRIRQVPRALTMRASLGGDRAARGRRRHRRRLGFPPRHYPERRGTLFWGCHGGRRAS